jgi:hypothetical protein
MISSQMADHATVLPVQASGSVMQMAKLISIAGKPYILRYTINGNMYVLYSDIKRRAVYAS